MKKYELGDFVYLITDPHKQRRQIVSLTLTLEGGGFYETVLGSEVYKAYEKELEAFND
jgi:hypothetical protein